MGVSRQPLRVAINAQLRRYRAGGIESVLAGLVHALGQLKDGSEEYIIIGHSADPQWLEAYMGPNQRIVCGPKRKRDPLKQVPKPLRRLARWVRNFLDTERASPTVPLSDGFYESLGSHVIHFPYQNFVLCAAPAVYNPHDLQHLHYPQFFTPATIAWRETMYRTGCRLARAVVVASEWIKQDIVRQYGVDPEKIKVVAWAPPTLVSAEPTPAKMEEVRRKHQLKEPFALYPAMTWPHKNHLALLEALALLRERHSLKVNLVCTGIQNSFWPEIEARLSALSLQDQVKFLGMISSEELRALYRLAQFVVVPTLFEAASGPLFEAWQEGTPVACSAVTSLPEQAADAALLFDPLSVEAIADAVARMATDGDLREERRRRGTRRLQDFSWERTAKAYRAVYRHAAGYPLTAEDCQLLKLG
jgi:glycosyltransferase involved in cell wall biosynthesis